MVLKASHAAYLAITVRALRGIISRATRREPRATPRPARVVPLREPRGMYQALKDMYVSDRYAAFSAAPPDTYAIPALEIDRETMKRSIEAFCRLQELHR